MESEIDRHFRRSAPQLMRRSVVLVIGAYAVNYIHAGSRPHILALLPAVWLSKLYVLFTSMLILGVTFAGLACLIVGYYYALSDRRLHTAMSELGLAIRTVIGGLVALAAFALAIHINVGG